MLPQPALLSNQRKRHPALTLLCLPHRVAPGGGYNPLPLKAGPSRLALGALGGGPSFMRQPQHATTGFDGKAKYIHRGPDGKGGQVSVYKGGGGAAPVAPAAGGGKRHKGGKGGAAGKGAASNCGVTIDLFFNRAS